MVVPDAPPLAVVVQSVPPGALSSPERPKPRSHGPQLELERWRRAKKMRQVGAVALLVSVLAVGVMMRDRLTGLFWPQEDVAVADQSAQREQAVAPLPVLPEIEPVQVDAPADEPVAVEMKTAADDADPLKWLLANKSRWPTHVSLREDAQFPVVFRGRVAGKVKVSAGKKVEVVEVGPEDITVRFREGTLRLTHGSTDLSLLAASLMHEKSAEEVSPNARQTPQNVVVEGKNEADPALLAAASRIDGLIRAHFVKNKLPPPLKVGDEAFLRRVYLVAVGRIPTAEEAAGFLADQNPHKRANLVASLVQSPGYASHMTNWMFDRLRIVDQNNVAQIRYPVYRRWVRNAIDQDVPWDRMVTELLTAKGGGWDEESAAVGYFTRDRGMPLDNLAVTMRIFLGSRMECAQCHDDPFGDTKQKDFFRLAAFTNGQDPMKQNLFYPIFREMDAMPQDSVEYNAAWMFWRDVYGNSLGGGGTGRIALPADYKYKDARPGDIEGARAPFGKSTSMSGTHERDDGRQRLAKWMTEGTEERFSGMIANGMWRRVMGAGYFEPGDDYLEPEDTHAPQISSHLAQLMKEQRYSLRDFQQTLMLTEVFQYEANPAESVADGGADDFRGRRVQRMTAEQVYDSLVTLVSGNPDNQPPRQTNESIYLRGTPVLEGQMNMAQLSTDVLAIEHEKKLRAYFLEFVAKIKAEQSGEGAESMTATMRGDPVDFVRGMLPRAADLQSPAPRNHFVALFGQSSRNIVDGSTREPNVGQVLSLMNGFVQAELVQKPEAQLNRDVESASSPEEKIRKLYLGIFSREPSAEELSLMSEEFSNSPAAAPANVASAMIMSAEFLYLQ
jgi:hypothetical protein